MDPPRMTLHYHGTPITPNSKFDELAGRCFCVSFARPEQVRRCHEVGQSVMLDNGAFSRWRKNTSTDWPRYYVWCEQWLAYPTTWAVIPDVIDGTEEEQDALLDQWPFRGFVTGSPVWHMNESLDRLFNLVDHWHRVCIGSTSVYARILSPAWERRMDQTWNFLMRKNNVTPVIHMLRGLQCVKHRWPFHSVDSTDIGRNHNREHNTPRQMADRWDAMQCGPGWRPR